MKAKDEFKKEGKLEIERGDVVTIIEGNASNYWWSGQNQRTLRIGKFPRAILDPQRRLNGEDISMPLKNSFIHTGHMSAGDRDKQWGNPGKIDEIFLRNPLIPPDLNDEPTAPTATAAPNDQDEPPPDLNDVNLINLSDSAPAAEVRITYPDFSFEGSAPSTSTSKSKSVSPPLINLLDDDLPIMPSRPPPELPPTSLYVNSNRYMHHAEPSANKPSQLATYYNASNELSLSSSASISTRPSSLGQSSGSSYYNSDQFTMASNIARCHDYQSSDTPSQAFNLPKIKLNSTNPFSDDINNLQAQSGAKKFNFAEPSQSQPQSLAPSASSNHLDDYLSKVMNDVLNDLKKPNISSNSQIKC